MTSTSPTDGSGPDAGSSGQERLAARQRASEPAVRSRRGRAADRAAAAEADVLAAIGQVPAADRALAEHVHRLVTGSEPDLAPTLSHGRPGHAREGKVVCSSRSGQVDGLRCSTVGFSPQAHLDEATGLWATSYASTPEATDWAWEQIADLVAGAAPTPPVAG